MNNSIKDSNLKEVTIQLKKAAVRKDILIKKIYKEYEIYFQIVRKSILKSTEKGILSIYSDLSISNKVLNSTELNNFLTENISFLIHSKLPFITIEQLKLGNINDPKKQILNKNAFKDLVKTKDYQTVDFDFDFDYENELIAREPLEFNCNNNSNTYNYYEFISEDQFLSVNLDESDYLKFSSEQITIKKVEDENIVNSVLELIEESNDNKLNDYEGINDQVSDVFISSDNLNFFEFIDKSFSYFLSDLSYKVNSELFKVNVIEKIISEETFKCLSNNNYIINHPHPFVIRYDLDSNRLSANNNKSPNIFFYNITNVELEFYNIDLSICRNNINELKNRFRLLNKKQSYWKHKELSLNNLN